jgi:hypothetical protein
MINVTSIWVRGFLGQTALRQHFSHVTVLHNLKLAMFFLTKSLVTCSSGLVGFNNSINSKPNLLSASSEVRVTSRVLHGVLVRRLLFRFLTHIVGGSLYILISRNLQRRLSLQELVFIGLQTQRIFARMPVSASTARRISSYPWRFGGTALYISVAIKDPHLLVSWLQDRLRTMTLFQHRRFFRTLAVTLKTSVLAPVWRYRLSGLRLTLLGKISVTGNAMTRTYSVSCGTQGNSALNIRTAQAFTLVRTRTGCLGLHLGFYF